MAWWPMAWHGLVAKQCSQFIDVNCVRACDAYTTRVRTIAIVYSKPIPARETRTIVLLDKLDSAV